METAGRTDGTKRFSFESKRKDYDDIIYGLGSNELDFLFQSVDSVWGLKGGFLSFS